MNAKTLVWLAAAVALLAQQTTPPPNPAAPQTGRLAPGGTGIIVGQVIDPGSGKPVPETIVWLLVGGILRSESPRVMTDADGRFFFINVPSGQYGLQAQKFGYMRGVFAQKLPLDEGRSLDITDGQLRTDVVLPIWKHAAIGGTVTDEAGDPVVGVTVQAFRKMVTFSEIRFTPSFQASSGATDDRGMFRISSLVPGEYAVGVASTLTTFPADVMPNLSAQSDLNRQAASAIREIGVLGDASNQRVGNSVLLTRRTALIPPPPGEQDVTAVYRTTLYPAATRPADATIFALGSGEERSGVDIALRPVRAVSVSGTVAAPDGPVGPTAIRLIPSGDAQISLSPGFETATGLTDAAGRFTLLGVPEGAYFLWVEVQRPAAPGATGVNRLWGNQPVVVGRSDVVDVAVSLRLPVRVTGRLELRSGAVVPDGFRVLVEPMGLGWTWEIDARPGGTFTMDVVPGRYLITPVPIGDVHCTSANANGRDVLDEPLTVGGDPVDLTIACGGTPTRVSGTVRSERGTADPDSLVVMFPTDRRYWTGAGLRPRRLTSARPSPAGAFAFTNIPAGDYFIAAVPVAGSDFWQDLRRLETLARTAQRIAVAAAESRSIDLQTLRTR